MTDAPLVNQAPEHVNVKELRERWGIGTNALKKRAEALGIELIRPMPNKTYWPGDLVHLGDQLNEWMADGKGMAMFPPCIEAQQRQASDESATGGGLVPAGSVSLSRTGAEPVPDNVQQITTTVVSDGLAQLAEVLRQQQQPSAVDEMDELVKAARHCSRGKAFSAAGMARLLGFNRMHESMDGAEPIPGFRIHLKPHQTKLEKLSGKNKGQLKDEVEFWTIEDMDPEPVADRSGTSLVPVPDQSAGAGFHIDHNAAARSVIDVQAFGSRSGTAIFSENRIH